MAVRVVLSRANSWLVFGYLICPISRKDGIAWLVAEYDDLQTNTTRTHGCGRSFVRDLRLIIKYVTALDRQRDYRWSARYRRR